MMNMFLVNKEYSTKIDDSFFSSAKQKSRRLMLAQSGKTVLYICVSSICSILLLLLLLSIEKQTEFYKKVVDLGANTGNAWKLGRTLL